MNSQFHEEFVALCALFHAGEISEEEWALLQIHMAYCDSCHEKFLEYQQIASDLIPGMAALEASDLDLAPAESAEAIDEAEQRLMRHLKASSYVQERDGEAKHFWRFPFVLIAAGAVVFFFMLSSHFFHPRTQPVNFEAPPAGRQLTRSPNSNSTTTTYFEEELEGEREKIATLEKKLLASENHFKKSETDLLVLERQLSAERAVRNNLSEERNTSREQLSETQVETESLRYKLKSVDMETTQQSAKIAVLEAKLRGLSLTLDARDEALAEKEQILDLDRDFLAHDKDIRDLIGARNLYIADISDTTESGKAAKQFGRIFYTEDRSLVFYGFDLDSQTGRKDQVSFQVWGNNRDRPSPVSLGLFYQDDAHKRWVLRCNDAKTLARLDMVFVTVEPLGGSTKPTGKQLLRAYLQIEPNHP